MVTASSSANASATPLVTINEIQPVKISLSLPQSDLPRIQEMARTQGLTIHMNMEEIGGGKDINAKVDFISNAVTNSTGTIELRATYANEDMALVPGQLVDVTVGLASIPNAVVTPREAVNTGPDGTFVYAVKDGTAQQIPVRVLFDDSVNAAVQGSLRAGDQVIVDGQIRVVPGAKVNVIGAKPAAGNRQNGVLEAPQAGTKTSGATRALRKDNEG
jgi:multidrug efflux system membrane fusion protein